MREYRLDRLVEWGDCDPAGIVFYPNYFRWMDAAFHAFSRSCGFSQASLAAEQGLFGTPLVEVGCTFRAPAREGDMLDIALEIEALGARSLTLRYGFSVRGAFVAEGREARVFVGQGPDGIRPAPIPAPILSRLEEMRDGR